MNSGKNFAGVIGFFDEPRALLEATRQVRDANFARFDSFTPYPVHGMDAAQGIKRSRIPYVTFVAGLCGFLFAFWFQYWTMAVDWPLNVGGKPFNSWPAFVPVMFELTVLVAGLSTLVAMLYFNRLPNVFRRGFDPSITRDRFALLIEPPASEKEATEFLEQIGAKEVRAVYAQGWFE
ncbi:MAG: hypothetical protein A2X94_17435 [Bdellovibrionales bacterium GWB1_55_8]|nr:MAG: hypothetical protein A2X94_17435 [Bdellovibrionales bacterium GWB1_55_8]